MAQPVPRRKCASDRTAGSKSVVGSSELVKNAGGRVHFQSPSGNASTEFIIGLPRSRSSIGEEGSKDYK